MVCFSVYFLCMEDPPPQFGFKFDYTRTVSCLSLSMPQQWYNRCVSGDNTLLSVCDDKSSCMPWAMPSELAWFLVDRIHILEFVHILEFAPSRELGGLAQQTHDKREWRHGGNCPSMLVSLRAPNKCLDNWWGWENIQGRQQLPRSLEGSAFWLRCPLLLLMAVKQGS